MTGSQAPDGAQRRQGRLVEWNDARGFGFIRWNGDAEDRLFVHIKSFPRGARPQVGDVLTYGVGMGERGRRAVDVRFATPPACGARPHPAPGGRRRPRGDRRGWILALLAAAAGVCLWHYPEGPAAQPREPAPAARSHFARRRRRLRSAATAGRAARRCAPATRPASSSRSARTWRWVATATACPARCSSARERRGA